jgi:hypothetical protein
VNIVNFQADRQRILNETQYLEAVAFLSYYYLTDFTDDHRFESLSVKIPAYRQAGVRSVSIYSLKHFVRAIR